MNTACHDCLTVFPMVQRTMFSVLKSTGHEVELLRALVGTLQKLLERRTKLSSAEVDLLDVLLQVLHHIFLFQ